MPEHRAALGRPAPQLDHAAQLAEPATARALWPTFMRRTLSEEALHEAGHEAPQAAPEAQRAA